MIDLITAPLLEYLRANAVKIIIRAGIISVLIFIIIGAALAVVGLSINASAFPEWTGLAADPLPAGVAATPVVMYDQDKELWDWLQLLLVPLVLAVGGFWLTRTENRYALELQERREQETQRLEDQRILEARRIEEERILEVRRIEEERAQDAALQAFFDQMTELLLHEKLRSSQPEDEVRSVARARALTVLQGLDGFRKGRIIQFLYEARLIGFEDRTGDVTDPIIHLTGADLSKIVLEGVDLSGVHLVRVKLNDAKMVGSTLEGANLYKTSLQRADLFGVNLNGAILEGANFTGARLLGSLRGATLERAVLGSVNLKGINLEGLNLKGANLEEACLEEVNLKTANLKGANLKGANLKGADLEHANLDGAHLEKANLEGSNLKGATLKGAFVFETDLRKASGVNGDIQGVHFLEPIYLEAMLKTGIEADTDKEADE